MIEQAWKDPSTNWFILTYYDDDWSGYECIFGFDVIKIYTINAKESTYNTRKKFEIDKKITSTKMRLQTSLIKSINRLGLNLTLRQYIKENRG